MCSVFVQSVYWFLQLDWKGCSCYGSGPESIEWIIDDQASLRSYDSALPPPPPPPPYPVTKLFLFLSLPTSSWSRLLTGEGVHEEPIIRRRESLVLNRSFNTLWGGPWWYIKRKWVVELIPNKNVVGDLARWGNVVGIDTIDARYQ